MDQKKPDPNAPSISSFVNPTETDVASFNALSVEERAAVIDRLLDQAVESGVSTMSTREIRETALRRVQARRSNAV